MSEYELYHHGIKGQKWGIRRTAAQLGHRVAGAAAKTGKVLYKGASKATKATGRAVKKGAVKAEKAAVAKIKQTHAENKEKRYYEKLHKKKLSQMTDKEIKDLTDRVKREAALKNEKYESRVQNARKFYKTVAQQPVNTFLATYSKKAVESMFANNKNDNDNNTDSRNNSSNNQKPKKSKAAPMEFEVTTESAPKKPSKKVSTNDSSNSTEKVMKSLDREMRSYKPSAKDAAAYIKSERDKQLDKVRPRKIQTDFDRYFEAAVGEQYKKDHGVLPYSTDGMTISEITRDKKYREKMGLPEIDYKRRVNY